MQVSISKMLSCHLDALSQIEKECFSRAWSREALESEINNENALFLVAESENEVLGYVGCIFVLGEGSITNVAVSLNYRRLGIGDALISALVENARKMDGECLFLEVRKSNIAAQNLYKKHGFENCGERKNFYREPCEDAYIMRLLLK